MNILVFRITSLLSGLLFGVGMVVSGMADPAKVVGFLDVAGTWDPSLMFVMGGALMVFMPAYLLVIKPRQRPLNANAFCLPERKNIDARLISGAAIFGLGWGLAGICPGPALSSLALGNPGVWLFFASMMVGFGAMKILSSGKKSRERQTQTV